MIRIHFMLNILYYSHGGARAVCRRGNLPKTARGIIIDLTVGIGKLQYLLKAEVVRFRRAVRGTEEEIDIAFLE